MTMTQAQTKVFVARIEGITQGKIADYKEKHKEPKRNLSNKEMFEEFKAGRFVIKEEVESVRGYSIALDEVCIFPAQVKLDCSHKEWRDKGNEYRTKVYAEQQKILDMAHFGDVSEALEMIRKFQGI